MKLPLYNQEAANVGSIELSDAVFALPMNRDLLYQVVTSQMANQRQHLAHAKGRAEVRGGGKKPWQQKGTGRARHGSIRSPIWKGGGVTHGPSKEKVFKKKINIKMARKALGIALSGKVRDHQIAVIDALALKVAKTKEMASVTRVIGALFKTAKQKTTPRMLMVVPSGGQQSSLRRTINNLPAVDMIEARNLNSLAVLANPYIVFLKDAISIVEKNISAK